MDILVTGASGFLGSHVAEQIKEQGHRVRCLVRASSKVGFLQGLGVDLVYGAVDAPDTLPAAVRGVDAVVHCAGVLKARNLEQYNRVNHEGTRAMLAAVAEHAPGIKRFVHVSTAGVLGPSTEGKPHTRESEPRPVTDYSRSKLLGERAVQEFTSRLPITILRPPAMYGPRDSEFLTVFKMVNLRVAVRLSDRQTLSMIYGPDCADACIRAIHADVPSGSVFLVEDGEPVTFDQMADAIADGLGVRTLARPRIPDSLLRLAAGLTEQYGKLFGKAVMFNRNKLSELTIEHFVCDGSDTRSALGWKPRVLFAEGARLTANWYRAHRWL